MLTFIPLAFQRLSPDESLARAGAFYETLGRRRSVRHFASDPLPPGLVETLVRAAGTAPSGANQRPWRFVVVTGIQRKPLDAIIQYNAGAVDTL